MRLLVPTLLAYATTAVLIRFVLLSSGVRERILSEPSENRWHVVATPSFGGLPMFAGVAAAVAATWRMSDRVTWGLIGGAGILLLVGVLDDRFDIKPPAKLAGQIAAAVITVAIASGDISLTVLGGLSVATLIVLMSNSVNLLDNMDGLAGGTSFVSLIVMLPVVLVSRQTGLALVVTAVIGALAGFLVFNLNPARVFMGDSGSMWLGLVLAGTVASIDYGGGVLAPIAVVTILAIQLLDTVTVVVSRLRHGLSITHGGSDHLSHRLVRLGLKDAQAVSAIVVAAGICVVAGVSRLLLPTGPWILVVGTLWAFLGLTFVKLLQVPVYPGSPTPTISGKIDREVTE